MKKAILLISISLSILLMSCKIETRALNNDDMNKLAVYMNQDIIQEINEEIESCSKEEFISYYIEKDKNFENIYFDYCEKENINH